jgi:hypothetical protein
MCEYRKKYQNLNLFKQLKGFSYDILTINIILY